MVGSWRLRPVRRAVLRLAQRADNTTRAGAKDPWGREAEPLAQRPAEAWTSLDHPKPGSRHCPTRPRGLWYAFSMDRAAEAYQLARTYVWWQEPAVTLADPRRLLCQILRLGRPEDYVAAEEIWGREAIRQALIEARRGEIDPKSDHFWRMRFGVTASADAEDP